MRLLWSVGAKTERSNVAQPDSVEVVVVKGANASKWYKDYRSKVSARTINGYGNEAFYDGYASFSVLKGDYYLRIAVSPAPCRAVSVRRGAARQGHPAEAVAHPPPELPEPPEPARAPVPPRDHRGPRGPPELSEPGSPRPAGASACRAISPTPSVGRPGAET